MSNIEIIDCDTPPPDGLLHDRAGSHRVVFLGRPAAPRAIAPGDALASLQARPASRCGPLPTAVDWNRQVHSNRVRDADQETARRRLNPDSANADPSTADSALLPRADALFTVERNLALTVFTADCVPVLIAGGRSLGTAAVHAGWRGLESRILEQTVARFDEPAERLVAWIGPAMGACCYQVETQVAVRVATASDPDVLVPRRPRPHLDLAAAALSQLSSLGLRDVRLLDRCTGCSPTAWWSYRRGATQGERNLAFIWRA